MDSAGDQGAAGKGASGNTGDGLPARLPTDSGFAACESGAFCQKWRDNHEGVSPVPPNTAALPDRLRRGYAAAFCEISN